MDKLKELKLFKYVYGSCGDWSVIKSEAPDFVCIRQNTTVLGAEITELYYKESDARLNKIDGYALELLDGGDFRHKEDKKNIKVDRVQYIKKGESKGREINAIIQELPINEERFSNLVKTIKEKEDKVSTYLEACPEVDLIIDDASSMFLFDKYEDFFFQLSQLVDKSAVINSRFREIFLITNKKQGTSISIPLKLSLFVEDVTIFEELILTSTEAKVYNDIKKAIFLLLCCLFQSNYENIGFTNIESCIGFVVGSGLYLYSKEGKLIRDYITIPEQLSKGELIRELTQKAGEEEKQIANRLIQKRKGLKCCVALYSEVNNE